MGIYMDDIHAPTVPSGPTTGVSSNGVSKEQLSLAELIRERDRVETELKALGSVLDSHGVNMNTSLTTFDGFPRSDIDVAQIRTTRARIIHLRNDYKDLMNRIEKGLHAHHAALQAAQSPGLPPAPPVPSSSIAAAATAAFDAPFAKVNSVVEGSPAAEAGLHPGDTIIRFGSVDCMNHEKLSKVAEVVSQSEGVPLEVRISRYDVITGAMQDISLSLTPKRDWGGRGLLGCHLLPI